MTSGRRAALALLAAGLAVLAGCGPRPRAPALEDNPVYVNDAGGFRFVVPEGWHQFARSELPPGKLDRERLLVQYRRLDPERQATLEVSAADLPASVNLTDYLADASYGAKAWRPQGKPEPVEGAGVPGTRYDFSARVGKNDLAREVIAFRRGERVYFFTVVYAARDDTAREQFRRSVARILWK
jgi:hypothetical protein